MDKAPGSRLFRALLRLASKYTFQLRSEDRHRPFPHKVLIGQGVNESVRHVALKFLAYVLFFHERLQVETAVQAAGTETSRTAARTRSEVMVTPS